MPISKERLAEIAAIPDEAIDTSDIPELDARFFENAHFVMPTGSNKRSVTMRVDEDVLDWFKAGGRGHLTRMNAVLRAYMLSRRSEEEQGTR